MAAQVKSAQVKQESGQLYVRVNGQSWQPCKMVDASPDGSIVVQTQELPQDKPQESGYNGWSNYETWCVNLHLSNDQYTRNQARRYYKSAEDLREWLMAEWYDLRENSQESNDFYACPIMLGMFQDLLVSSLQSVNWYEIYDSLHKEEDSDECPCEKIEAKAISAGSLYSTAYCEAIKEIAEQRNHCCYCRFCGELICAGCE